MTKRAKAENYKHFNHSMCVPSIYVYSVAHSSCVVQCSVAVHVFADQQWYLLELSALVQVLLLYTCTLTAMRVTVH